MNASDVIEDRVVFEAGNVQYVACIVPDMDAPNPVEEHEARMSSRSHAMQSLDLFDAASYPDPSLYDVAGAYQARLNAGMESIGECTRKLREGGYRRIPGIIAIG
jgi:hypothetical protein